MKQANKYIPLLLALLFLPLIHQAQDGSASGNSTYFSNALFNTLLVVILVLMIVIVTLGQVLRNIAQSDIILNRLKEKKNGAGKAALLLFGLSFYQAGAQTSSPSDAWLIGGIDSIVFFFMLAVILVEALVIKILYSQILGWIGVDKPLRKPSVAEKPKSKSILETLNASVAIEKEEDIMLGHEYDGIRELDNDLPPWWKYGFYLTILVSVVYMIHFHVTRTGDLQDVEYEKSIALAKREVEAYMKTAASNVDETTVRQLEGADLASGKDLFIANCAACHGKEGQGTVGPNLADDYWMHGGGLADIFKSIKYGWVDNGMKAWKEDLSPMQIAQISSFIRTLKGTNPAGGKEAQGDLYHEEAAVSDSSLVKTDSLSLPADTLK
jgi:cytochrome c oxidase cbb3-type subunit 3